VHRAQKTSIIHLEMLEMLKYRIYPSNMNRNTSRLLPTILLSTILFNLSNAPLYASTDDQCPFGQTSTEVTDENYDTSYTCNSTLWDFTSTSDGFSKKTVMTIPEDLAGMPSDTIVNNLTMVIRCQSKKLEVYFVSNLTLFNNLNRSYEKKLLYKVDNGKIVTISFSEATSDTAFFASSPAKVMADLVKGKSKFSIKFSNNKGQQVSQFPISNLGKYRTKFAAAGCKF